MASQFVTEVTNVLNTFQNLISQLFELRTSLILVFLFLFVIVSIFIIFPFCLRMIKPMDDIASYFYVKNKNKALKIQSKTIRAKKRKYISYLKNVITIKNENIKIEYNTEFLTIKLYDTKSLKSTLAENFFVYNIDKVFNGICSIFDENTGYDEILTVLKQATRFLTQTENKITKINLNSCTVNQLAALPGINIALAKRIIAKRKEKNGFSSFDEFFEEFHIKKNFQKQIKNLAEIQAEELINLLFNNTKNKQEKKQNPSVMNENERKVDF